MNHAARSEILSQLREIFDGSFKKAFGTGEEIDWTGDIGFIAGVTEAVDIYQGVYNILGERFVQYRIKQPGRKEATLKGMDNAANKNMKAIREKIRNSFTAYINNIPIPSNLPAISDEWRDEIVELCEFATRARTGVVRDSKTRKITHAFEPKMPVRCALCAVRIVKPG